jgi:hypothetical protein
VTINPTPDRAQRGDVPATARTLFDQLAEWNATHPRQRVIIPQELRDGITSALLEVTRPLPSTANPPVRDRIRDFIAATLADQEALACTRVWSAWDVGTMREDDFVSLAEIEEAVDELTDAVMAAMSEPVNGKPQPHPMSTEPSIIDQDTITTYTGPEGDALKFEGSDPRVLRSPGCCCVIVATECGVPLTPEQARHLAGRLRAAAQAVSTPAAKVQTAAEFADEPIPDFEGIARSIVTALGLDRARLSMHGIPDGTAEIAIQDPRLPTPTGDQVATLHWEPESAAKVSPHAVPGWSWAGQDEPIRGEGGAPLGPDAPAVDVVAAVVRAATSRDAS